MRRSPLAFLLVCAAFAGACSFRDDDVAPKVAQTTSALSTAPAATQLLVLDGGRLFGVAAQGGAAGALTADDWTGARAIASVKGVAYAVEGATLYRIDPISGARTALGSPAWEGTSLLASYDGWLYAIQGAGLYRINPTDGTWVRVGTGDWTGTSSLTGDTVDDLYLYAVQGPELYRIDFYSGMWTRIGSGDWTGTNVLAGYQGNLYAVQGPGLWRVNVQDGTWARVGTKDWTGTVALASDTHRLYAIQGGALFAIDPISGAATQLDSNDWSAASGMTVTTAAKPHKSVVISATGITGAITALLGNTYLRLDQTGNPSNALQVTARHQVCSPASSSAIAACRAKCPDEADGDPNLLKACYEKCSALQVCNEVCDTHATSDYVLFSDALKSATLELCIAPGAQCPPNKTCTTPAETCPACTVGDMASVVEDIDVSAYMPVPTFKTVVASNPMSCMLQTFGIAITATADNVAQSMGLNDYHLDIAGFSSDPTLVCTIGINPTITDPHFIFDMTPIVKNHHPSLSITANFTGHVDYAFDWIYDLDNTLSSQVRGMIADQITKNQATLDKEFEAYLLKEIGLITGDTQIDDWIDVHVDSDGIHVEYTPSCVDGICSCTADCGAKTCGTDQHCGNEVCGTCGAGLQCDDGAGTCVCAPQCDGKTCGPDGCGGTCGDCGAGAECLASGTCCTPKCDGKTCGDDGCGGTCGTCNAPDVCNATGNCECIPRYFCDGACGTVLDGCGGTLACGGCAAGLTCSHNRCTTCVPSCAGKRCGAPNGCGGLCAGSCAKAGYYCTDDGQGDYYCSRGF
jgi:hypothetical protein